MEYPDNNIQTQQQVKLEHTPSAKVFEDKTNTINNHPMGPQNQSPKTTQQKLPAQAFFKNPKPLEDEEIIQTDEIDRRSIYVKNLDYGSTEQDIAKLFKQCGKVIRVSIMYDKYSNLPKGYCYVEFREPDSVEIAIQKQNGSSLHGRELQVWYSVF